MEEEIVDYEPWMGDGGIFTVDEAKMHPECWLTKAEVKEIDATKKVLEEERRARERCPWKMPSIPTFTHEVFNLLQKPKQQSS